MSTMFERWLAERTHEEAARSLGVERTTITRIAGGRSPSRRVLERIAERLGRDVAAEFLPDKSKGSPTQPANELVETQP